MNDKLRKRLIDGITVISNPFILFGVVLALFLSSMVAKEQLGTLLGIIAIAYFLLALIGGQLAKSGNKKSHEKTP